MERYLTDNYHTVKIKNSHGLWSLIKYGIPWGSILNPILLNIFLCDMSFLVDLVDIEIYADDNIPYTTEKTNIKLKTI